jgi:hypothetical protein
MMWTAISRLRLALPIMTGFVMLLVLLTPGQAAEPSAAGLWQKVEDGKPVAWFAANAPTTARMRR